MKYFAESNIDDKDLSKKITVLINVTGFEPDDRLKEIITEHGDKIFQSILKYVGWIK